MTRNAELIREIRQRQQKNTEFNYGIIPADAYVKTLEQCVGSDLCYRYAAKGTNSFDDIMRKAAKTLTYCNPEMTIEEKATDLYTTGKLPEGIVLPKNTLMVFKHILTTPRKDRDGDILRTQGAQVDPKMLLLWQHVHTLPIGKYLGTAEHTAKKLVVYSAVVDMNELAHDAAVMIDNDMGRFSHGFRAIDFDNLKEEGSGRTSGKGGFDVKEFEIMEESVVSVPSNVGADTEEIILSLVDGRKLKSPLMKQVGSRIREKRPMTIPVKIDLNLSLNGKSINGEQSAAKGGDGEGCGCGGAPKEADGKATGKEEGADDKEMTCKCGGKMKDGKCDKCGKAAKDTDVDGEKAKKGECPDCGAKLTDDGICEECGYGMEEEKAEVDQANADSQNDMGEVMCPACGTVALQNGKCPKCGQTASAGKSATEQDKEYDEQHLIKAGRVLSGKNKTALGSVREGMQEIHDKELLLSKGGRAICREGIKTLDDVIKSSEPPTEVSASEITVKEAMAIVLTKGTPADRQRMVETIKGMDEVDTRGTRTKKIRALLGR